MTPSPFPAPNWLEEAIKKYKRKLSHVRLTKIIRSIQDDVHANAGAAQAILCLFDEKLKYLLEQEGIYSDWHPSYMAYARALEKSQKDLTFMVDLIREHQILRDRWERRGLSEDILDKIDAIVIIHS